MAQPLENSDPEIGCSLKEILSDSRAGAALPFAPCAYLLVEVAKQLLTDVIHGEIIPQNILVATDGTLHLAEPGTSETDLSDNIAYLAPERIRGKKAEARSDLFTLAAVFTEALTGVSFQTVKLMNEKGKNPLSLVDPDVPTALVPVIRRALSLKPEERFTSVAEMYGLVKPLLPPPLLEEGKRFFAAAAKRSAPAPVGFSPEIQMGEADESRSYNPPPPAPAWEDSPAAPTLVTKRERARTNAELGYREKRAPIRVRKSWWVTGILAVLAGAWLISFLNYLAPISETPTERVETNHNSPVYVVPGPGGRCLLELDTKPTGAQVRVNRVWSGGITPTILALPCQQNLLLTLKAPDGNTTHQFFRPTQLVEVKKYRISKSFYAKLAKWIRLLIAFHTNYLGNG